MGTPSVENPRKETLKHMTDTAQPINVDAIDFFRDESMLVNPYPYYEALRSECPIRREPHHNVMMVTGYDEALAIYNDTTTWSSCTAVTGPFPGFPVSLDEYADGDITDLILKHRDSLPMSDQLPTLDPPMHTDHRALLMRLITPKRLKENEEFIWKLADKQILTFLAAGECEFIADFGGPFAMLVIADLLGVPLDDHARFEAALIKRSQSGGGAIGSTKDDQELGHAPLEYLYHEFTAYIEDRRANPTDDVLTGLAQATFPDGSTPEVIDVVRIAANVFSAGQETTVRLLGTMVQVLADDPEVQAALRADRDLIPNFVEECLRFESPVKGDFRLSRRAHHGGRCSHSRGHHGHADERRRQPRPSQVRRCRHVRRASGQRSPARCIRPRHPHVPRNTARSHRREGVPRADARPH